MNNNKKIKGVVRFYGLTSKVIEVPLSKTITIIKEEGKIAKQENKLQEEILKLQNKLKNLHIEKATVQLLSTKLTSEISRSQNKISFSVDLVKGIIDTLPKEIKSYIVKLTELNQYKRILTFWDISKIEEEEKSSTNLLILFKRQLENIEYLHTYITLTPDYVDDFLQIENVGDYHNLTLILVTFFTEIENRHQWLGIYNKSHKYFNPALLSLSNHKRLVIGEFLERKLINAVTQQPTKLKIKDKQIYEKLQLEINFIIQKYNPNYNFEGGSKLLRAITEFLYTTFDCTQPSKPLSLTDYKKLLHLVKLLEEQEQTRQEE